MYINQARELIFNDQLLKNLQSEFDALASARSKVTVQATPVTRPNRSTE